jgi:hypothetical protein
MIRDNSSESSIQKLVDRFVSIALAQDRAMLIGNNAEFNRLYRQMEQISARLKAFEGDARRLLVQLHNHPNAQVRLTSAIETLALEPIESRRVLQSISDRNEYPQAANARGMMMALDEGRYTPT